MKIFPMSNNGKHDIILREKAPDNEENLFYALQHWAFGSVQDEAKQAHACGHR